MNSAKTISKQHDLILRQIAMLRVIPKYPQKISAKEIVSRLDNEGFQVSKRTIERDLQGLSASFPLMADERSKPYGWSWSADAPAIDLPGLSISEALTLKMAEQYLSKLMPISTLHQLDPYFKAASKVLDSVEASSKLSKWPAKIAVVLPSQPLLPPVINSSISAIVDDALLHDRQLRVEYQNRDEPTPKSLAVHPLGIILRGQIIYLCCTIGDYQDIRLLALHRFRSANILEQVAKRPAEFNLSEYANSGAMGFINQGEKKVKLRFTREAGLHLYETPLSNDQVITDEGDFLTVEATVAINKQFEWWINGFGGDVTKLGKA